MAGYCKSHALGDGKIRPENIIQDRTFEKFQAVEPWQKRLKEGTQEYARDLPGWLLLCGQSGSGKTHLATAVCRQRLLQGDEVRYMPWRDKIGEIKSMSLDVPRRLELIQGYKQAQVLYIDDLYKNRQNCRRQRNALPGGFESGL